MPVLELTTIGRRSGLRRTVLLTSPCQDGDALVVVGSKAGSEEHPAWFLNLRDDPEVEVATRRQPTHRRRARVATADERARLWPQVVAAYANYDRYQERTDREIPVVLLEPVTDHD